MPHVGGTWTGRGGFLLTATGTPALQPPLPYKPRPKGPGAPRGAARPPRHPPATGREYLLVLPQVLLTGSEHLRWLRLSEGTQGTTDLLLHQRVLVGDGLQQDGGQLYRDKARRACSGPADPASHRLGL